MDVSGDSYTRVARSGRSGDNPPITALPLTPGTRLGAYEVVAPIGAGGMGEVYRARDTRLDRTVAIKVLPAEFATDAALRLRFEREAKTISAITHPNICALFDVGEAGQRSFLVMEYLDGESLADRIAKGPIPIDQVLRVGIDIASALDAAHRRGIVHRDVKPGNIMLTRSGAKLLDFGLAKEEASALGPQASVAETQHKPITEKGTILGTFQYMAPEQVEGLPADARSDLFSLGAVLYEASTGQRAFDGKSRASLIAAILDHEPPPIVAARPMTPPMFDRVVRSLLRKDPEERLQTAHDLLLQLNWIRESTSSGEAMPVGASPQRRRRINWLAIALAATTILFAVLFFRSRGAQPELTTFSIVSPPGMSQGVALALSPDGRAVAYTAGRSSERTSLWIRRFRDREPVKIANTEGAMWPFWSPDGQSIGFFAEGDLKRVNVATGTIQRICDASYGVGAAWSEDGTIIFSSRFGDSLKRVPAAGGKPQPVTILDVKGRQSMHGWPHFLADGKHFAFLIRTVPEERSSIAIGSVDGGEAKTIVRADSLAGVQDDHLLYVREGVLHAHRLDAGAQELSGEPVEITNVAYSENWALSGVSVRGHTLVYYPPFVPRADVLEYDRRGFALRTLMSDHALYRAQLSPDGTQLLVHRGDPRKGAADIWLLDVERGTRRRLTSGLSNNWASSWSPDGTRIAFSNDRAGMYDIYTLDLMGSAQPQVVVKNDRDKSEPTWTPDGRIVFMQDQPEATAADIYVQGDAAAIIATPAYEDHPAVSPDGRWIAYAVRQSAADGDLVMVAPFPRGRAVQISTAGGTYPAWSGDGSEIFYAGTDGMLMSVAFRNGKPDMPKPLFKLPRTTDRPFTVTADGTFVIAALDLTESDVDRIEVMMNWREKLP